MILTRAARGLIRGSREEEASLQGRQPALLYFDELQITDPFTAVSLKGMCHIAERLGPSSRKARARAADRWPLHCRLA